LPPFASSDSTVSLNTTHTSQEWVGAIAKEYQILKVICYLLYTQAFSRHHLLLRIPVR